MSFLSVNDCVSWVNKATERERFNFLMLNGNQLMHDVDNGVLSSACVLLVVFSKHKAPDQLNQHAKKAWDTCVDNILSHDSVTALYSWELNERDVPFDLDLDRPKLIRTAIFAAKEAGAQKKLKWKNKLWGALYLCIIETEKHTLKDMFTNKFVKMLSGGTLACVPTSFSNPNFNCLFISIMAICLNTVVKYMGTLGCGKRGPRTFMWRKTKKQKIKKIAWESGLQLVPKPEVDQSMFSLGCVSCLVHCATIVSRHSGLSLSAPALPMETFEVFSGEYAFQEVVSDLLETISEIENVYSKLVRKSITGIPFGVAMVLSMTIPVICRDMFAVTSWINLLALSKNPMHSTTCVQACLQMCFRIATWNTPIVSRAALRLEPLSNWVIDCPSADTCTHCVRWLPLSKHRTRADVCGHVCRLYWDKMRLSETWHVNVVIENWRKKKAKSAQTPPENVLSFDGHVRTPAECFVCCGSDVGSLVILAPCGHCMCCLCAPRSGEACYVCKQTVSCVVNKVYA